MANIKLTLPGEPFTKQIVTFTAPCDCASVTNGLVINGQTYTVCDAMGNCVTGKGGAWCEGAQISVVLDCEKKKAYVQNAANGGGIVVNPSLLDNWYFANPVNQRKFTEGSVSGNTVDRWCALNQQYVKVIDGVGLQLSPNGTSNRHFLQYIEHPERVAGKKVTFSILIAENAYSNTSYISLYVNGSAMTGANIASGRTGLHSITLTVPENVTSLAVLIRSNASLAETGAITILAAKLELGDAQTLAHQDADGNWVLNEIPDYNEELLKCCMSTADPADDYANNKKTPAAIGALNGGECSNIDTHDKEGIFTVKSNAGGTFPSEAGGSTGVVIHRTWDVNYKEQVFLSYFTGQMYHRIMRSATWGDWKRLATTDYALNKAGDTMTGPLGNSIDGLGTARFYGTEHGAYLEAYRDYSKRRQLIVQNVDTQPNDKYGLMMWVAETNTSYPILHTGNKHLIAPAEIGAAAASHTHAVSEIAGCGKYQEIRYTGTGALQSHNAISFTFDFAPTLLIIGTYGESGTNYVHSYVGTIPFGLLPTDSYVEYSSYTLMKRSADGKTFTFYSTQQNSNLWNFGNQPYFIIALA